MNSIRILLRILYRMGIATKEIIIQRLLLYTFVYSRLSNTERNDSDLVFSGSKLIVAVNTQYYRIKIKKTKLKERITVQSRLFRNI